MRLLALAAPLALAALAPAQTVLLRFKPPVGKTVSYVSTMNMVQGIPGAAKPMTITQTMPMTYRVVSRTANSTTLQTKVGEVKNSMMKGKGPASGMTSTTVVDELGNLKGMNAAGGAAAMANGLGNGMMAGAQGVSFPKQALKVGDSWSASLDMGKMLSKGAAGAAGAQGMKANGKLKILYRLVGIEKRGGLTLAKLSVTMSGAPTMSMNMGGPSGKGMTMAMNINSKGSFVVDAATGLVQTMTNVSDTTTAVMGQNMKQHMVMTMKAQ